MTEHDRPAADAVAPDSATGELRRRRARRTIVLLAAIAIAPVAASYAVYYFFPRDVQANHGTLLPTAPADGRGRRGTARSMYR
jgi:hypothetical protein